MDLHQIKQHWANWSAEFKTDLKATTKTLTIKKLEINALKSAIEKIQKVKQKSLRILEVGCGNGHNCFALAEFFPQHYFIGVDYIPEMILSANTHLESHYKNSPAISFVVGDALDLENNEKLSGHFDIVFTDRCLINLNKHSLQLTAINQLIKKLNLGGHLILLENFTKTHNQQNFCRKSVGLQERKPADFNLFMDLDSIIESTKNKLELMELDDFGSLHDIILYVLVPMINNGKIDYNHPLVAAATELSLAIGNKFNNSFGSFGQNRLLLFRKIDA